MMKSKPFSVAAQVPSPAPETRFLNPSARAWLMGVVNVTPDSFYAGSRAPSLDDTLRLAGRLIAEGADLLDIGGESTRPGSIPINEAAELARILPVIEALHSRWPDTPLSIDTQKASVARAAFQAGACIINDVSAFRHDPEMVHVVAEAGCPVVLMHMQGTPATMQQAPHYEDVVSDVKSFFEERIAFAERQGVAEDQIILDPGIGFGKTTDHNLSLLRHLQSFRSLGRPLLIGVSRKAFIGRILGGEDSPLAAEERLEGSIAAGLWAVQSGASGLRVHDVGATRQALRVWEGLARA